MDVYGRIEAYQARIKELEAEAQQIYETFAAKGEQPSGEEGDRLLAILGPQHDGLSKDCLMQQTIESLRTAENIKAGLEARQEALKNTTPEQPEQVEQLKRVAGVGIKEFAMGCTRKPTIPAQARMYSSNLENSKEGRCWGDTKQEREENAYAAGMWFLATVYSQHPDTAHTKMVSKAKQWCRDHGLLGQQQTGDDGKGGYLVPTPLERTVIEIRQMYGKMRQNARIYPMSSKTLDIPKFAAGLEVLLVAELAAQVLTEKTWGQVNLTAKKAGGFAQWSTEVGEDAVIALASDLARDFGIAFAYREDFTGFMGDGVADAANMGITGVVNALNAAATNDLAATNTTVADITLQDFEGLLASIANVAVNPRWYMHKSVYYTAAHPVKTAAGGNTIGTLTDGDPMSPNSDFRFLGYEGNWVDVLPDSTAAAGTKGVVIFGDLNRGVAMGERRGVTIKTSEHIKIIEDAMVMTANSRFDIVTHEDGTAADSRVIAQIALAAS